MNDLIGKTIKEKYVIRHSLGDGGHGEVWLADDKTLQRQVAVKRLRSPDSSPQIDARFKQEAIIMATLNHPNIIPIFDMFEDDGRFYLVMEYCAAGSLKTFLYENGALPLEETVELGKSVARALQVMHGKGIIHRDVKPGNILLSQNGEGLTIKLTDFGIAHHSRGNQQLTQTGDVMGTPLYLAPEQITGRAVNKTDVYALGALLYGLLAGRHYLDLNGDSFENRRCILEETPLSVRDVRSDVPVWLDELIIGALSKTAGKRPSATQFYNRLQSQGASDYPSAPTPKIQDAPAAMALHRPWLQKGLIAAITWIVVAAAMILGYRAYKSGQPPLPPVAVPYQTAVTEEVLTTTVRSEYGAVNLRSAPALSAEVVGQLADGTAVTLQAHDESGDWFYLLSGEMAGWMYGDYLLPADGWEALPIAAPPAEPEQVVAVEEEIVEETAVQRTDTKPEPTPIPPEEEAVLLYVTDTAPAIGLRLRSGPSQDDPILAVLADETAVNLLTFSDDGDWAQVDALDETGWVYAAYLSDIAP